jgi:hypothetical protein
LIRIALTGDFTFCNWPLSYVCRSDSGRMNDRTQRQSGDSRRKKTSMKSTMKTSICLPMAAMFLTTALAGPLAAEKYVPFKGSVQGHDTVISATETTLVVNGNVTGVATQLGTVTLTSALTVDRASSSGTGFGQLVAANGDTIFTTIVVQSQPTDTLGVEDIVEVHTITGGTGRFAGAKGSFTLTRLLTLATLSTSGSFQGMITSPGSAR